jgi:hypothetical protein
MGDHLGVDIPVRLNQRADEFDAVLEQGRTVLADPKLKQFHRLRIQTKRLRYLNEFMAPAYDGALDGFIERMVEIQDCLGELQDTVFTSEALIFYAFGLFAYASVRVIAPVFYVSVGIGSILLKAFSACVVGGFGNASGTIWAGSDDGLLHRTTDGGKTWKNLTENIPGLAPNSPVSHVEPSRTGPDAAYVQETLRRAGLVDLAVMLMPDTGNSSSRAKSAQTHIKTVIKTTTSILP